MAYTLAHVMQEIASLRREVRKLTEDSEEWLTARETGKTQEQLRYFRKIHPEKVKPTKDGTRSYLYKIKTKPAMNSGGLFTNPSEHQKPIEANNPGLETKYISQNAQEQNNNDGYLTAISRWQKGETLVELYQIDGGYIEVFNSEKACVRIRPFKAM